MAIRFTLACLVLFCTGCLSSINPFDGSGSTEINAKQQADITLSMAEVAERGEDYNSAIKSYQKVLESFPDDAHVLHRLALAYDKNGNHAKAAEYFQLSLEIAPDNTDCLSDFGYCLYRQDQMEAALEQYHAALSINPDLPRCHNNLAMVHGRMGHYDAALTEFRLAGLSEVEARCNLAMAMLLESEPQMAKAEIQRARAAHRYGRLPEQVNEVERLVDRAFQHYVTVAQSNSNYSR